MTRHLIFACSLLVVSSSFLGNAAARPASRDNRSNPSTSTSTTSTAPPSSTRPPPRSRPTSTTTNGTIPDDGRVCIAERYGGKKVTIRDHRSMPLRCKIEIAQHNRDIAAANGGADNALGYDAALRRLEVEQAVIELQAAAGSARAAAEGKLNRALDALDKVDDKLAARAKSLTDSTRREVEARVADLSKQITSATGQAKQELEARKLKAQQTIKRIEQRLAELDLDAARAKLDSAAKRVGDKAAELRSQAQAKVAQVEKQLADVRKRVDAAIKDLEAKLDKLSEQVQAVVDDAEKALKDAEDGLDDLTEGLDDLF